MCVTDANATAGVEGFIHVKVNGAAACASSCYVQKGSQVQQLLALGVHKPNLMKINYIIGSYNYKGQRACLYYPRKSE